MASRQRIGEIDERVSVHAKAFESAMLQADVRTREQGVFTFATAMSELMHQTTRGERQSSKMTEALQVFSKEVSEMMLKEGSITPEYVLSVCRDLQERETGLLALLRSLRSDQTGLVKLRELAEEKLAIRQMRRDGFGIGGGIGSV